MIGAPAPFTQVSYVCGRKSAAQYISRKAGYKPRRRRPEVGSQVSSDLDRPQSWARALPARVQVLIVVILVFAVGAGIWVAKSRTNSEARDPDIAGSNASKK